MPALPAPSAPTPLSHSARPVLQLLSCANKFKKQEMSVRAVASKDQESVKHANTVDETYVSSYSEFSSL